MQTMRIARCFSERSRGQDAKQDASRVSNVTQNVVDTKMPFFFTFRGVGPKIWPLRIVRSVKKNDAQTLTR